MRVFVRPDLRFHSIGGRMINARAGTAAEHPDVRVIGMTVQSSELFISAMKDAGADVCLSKADLSIPLLQAIDGIGC
ncbi:MAG: hypothetical protein ACOWWM_19415 [Desulfobacterales bacterium]